MYSLQPKYGKHYAPGYDLYTYDRSSFISKGIVWFESVQEVIQYASLLKTNGLSHEVGVIDETQGIEDSVHGVQFCDLSKYLDDPNTLCVFREPIGLTDEAVAQKIAYLKSQLGVPYDYTGLGGFALSILLPIQNLFPFWRKLPLPFHTPNTHVCDTLQMDAWKHTDLYRDIPLFQQWNIQRITVNKAWNQFPYKPLKLEVKNEKKTLCVSAHGFGTAGECGT